MQEMVIIAPYFMHRDILDSYRRSDAFSHVKVVSKEELMSSYFGKSRKDAIPFIMKEMNVNYATAKEILRYAPFAKLGINEKIDRLFLLKEKLLAENLLVTNKYAEYLFKNTDVKVIGYSKHDQELIMLINKMGINPQYIVRNYIPELSVHKFNNGHDEIFFVINEIAHLLDSGADPKNIYVVCKNEEYLHFFKNYSDGFGFNLNIRNSLSWYSQEISLQILKRYAEIKDISQTIEEFSLINDNEQFGKLFKLFLENQYDGFSFEEQYRYYVSLLKNERLDSSYYKNAISVTSDLIYKEHAHIFVVGFVQGLFPALKKDIDYLTDTEKKALGLNTTVSITDMSFELIGDFLSNNNEYHISYSLSLGSNSYHKSPLIKSYGFKEIDEYLPSTLYSKQYCDFSFSKNLDLSEIYYEETADYHALKGITLYPKKYDNRYTTVNANNDKKEMRYSYSGIKKLYGCPFSYYLEKELKIEDDDDEKFGLVYGNIAHYIFEHSFDSDFDFEKCYQEECEKYTFTPSQKVIMEGLKEQFRKAVDAYLLHFNNFMYKPKVYTELSVNYHLDDKTILNGKIDKAICLDDKYVVLVDYKTGRETFNPKQLEYGVSLQLPTYMLLCEEEPKLKDKQIVGIYINNVINPSTTTPSLKEDEKIPKYLKLNGKTLFIDEIVNKIDQSFYEGNYCFISSLRYGKTKNALSGSTLASESEFESYKQIALDCYKSADQRIRNNDFPINPVQVGSNDPCKFCNYRDICFLRSEQKIKIGKNDEEEEDE